MEDNNVGVYLRERDPATFIQATLTGVSITCSSIENNGTGIIISNNAAAGNGAHSNNIAGNTVIGIQNDDLLNTFDAEDNWWGYDSGPGGPGGSGSGDGVSSNVDFTPWIDNSVETTTHTGDASFGPDQGNIVGLTAVTPPVTPPVELPHGMFSFQVCCINPGETVTLTVTLPGPVPVGTKWWKYQNGGWYSLPNLSDNGDAIMVISLTDGGSGDEDSVPGQITDDGGPGAGGAVGWDTYPINKVRVLLPLIALLAAFAVGVSLLVLRHRRTTT